MLEKHLGNFPEPQLYEAIDSLVRTKTPESNGGPFSPYILTYPSMYGA